MLNNKIVKTSTQMEIFQIALIGANSALVQVSLDTSCFGRISKPNLTSSSTYPAKCFADSYQDFIGVCFDI